MGPDSPDWWDLSPGIACRRDSPDLLGDSFTEGMSDELRPDGRHRGWSDRLATGLAADRSGVAHYPVTYANLAIRGKLLDQVVAKQFGPALTLQPDIITFHAGANDVLRPGTDLPALYARYDTAVAEAAPPPAHGSSCSPRWPAPVGPGASPTGWSGRSTRSTATSARSPPGTGRRWWTLRPSMPWRAGGSGHRIGCTSTTWAMPASRQRRSPSWASPIRPCSVVHPLVDRAAAPAPPIPPRRPRRRRRMGPRPPRPLDGPAHPAYTAATG